MRSDILVHWTGKNCTANARASQRTQYHRLLAGIYAKGLRYHYIVGHEVIAGSGTRVNIPQVPMICYTELRLSAVKTHIQRYGRIGIGFRREYLMRCGANPVFYVQNANQGVVNTNLSALVTASDRIPGNNVLTSFFKSMSEENEANLTYYDEMEWRMVICNLNNKYPKWIRFEGQTPYFRFPLSEVALLVFPDEPTRKAILKDNIFRRNFSRHMPMMVDADKCDQF